MTSRKVYDVAVLGSGIVGTTLALMLERQGLEVIAIDRPSHSSSRGTANEWAVEREGSPQRDQPHTLLSPAVRVLQASVPDVLENVVSAGGRVRDDTTGHIVDLPTAVRFSKIETRRVLLERSLKGALDDSGVATRLAHVRALECADSYAAVISPDDKWHARVVLDCRGSKARPLAGETLGSVDQVSTHLVYNTVWFSGPPSAKPSWSQLDSDRYSVLTFAADNDYLAATIAVLSRGPLQGLIRHLEAFLGVLSKVPGCESLTLCAPLSRVLTTPAGGNYWRSSVGPYGLTQSRLLRCGDAMVRTNPTFGRGISMGLLAAERIANTIGDALEYPVRHAVLLHMWEQARLRPWFDGQCLLDRAREKVMRGVSVFSPTDGLYASLAQSRFENPKARQLINEVKHMERTWPEVAADPVTKTISDDNQIGDSRSVSSLPTEESLLADMVSERSIGNST